MKEFAHFATAGERRYPTIFVFAFFMGGLMVYFGKPILLGGGKITGCRANHYAEDTYLAYCASKDYGNFEHGAFLVDKRAPAVGNIAGKFAFHAFRLRRKSDVVNHTCKRMRIAAGEPSVLR